MRSGYTEMENTQPRRLAPRIEADPRILSGKPVIAGTRLSVELILEELASGYTYDDLLDAHPFLSVENISAALAYEAHPASLPACSKEQAAS